MIEPVDAHQSSPEFWDRRGCTLCETEQFAAAIVAFDRAIALNPRYCQSWNNKGNALCGLKRYAEALSAYEQAISLHPHYHQAWFNRGLLFVEMGAYSNAIASYNSAINLYPDPRYLHARQDIWIKEKLCSVW